MTGLFAQAAPAYAEDRLSDSAQIGVLTNTLPDKIPAYHHALIVLADQESRWIAAVPEFPAPKTPVWSRAPILLPIDRAHE